MAREFIINKEIVLGENALVEAGSKIKALGNKALVVTDKIMVQLGNVKKLTDVLDNNKIQYEIFDGINGEPTDAMIIKGVEAYKNAECDFLISIGGGSPIDAMKAIGIMADYNGKIADYNGKIIEISMPNMVAIPTTAGTGSETTQFTIITDEQSQVKMLLKGKVLMPTLAIVDPIFSMTVPKSVTAATGIDALCHAVEAYTSRRSQYLSDTFALSAIKRIFNNIELAYNEPSNVEARTQMAIASLEAGIAFNNSSVTLIHGMSRPIGALFHVPHGISNAMLMKVCLTYALEGAINKFANIASEIGIDNTSDEKAAKAFLDKLKELLHNLEIPTLEKYGINKDEFFNNIEKMATDAIASGSPSNTIKEIAKEDVVELYKNLWL
ncbi:alcohol dehydrogenase [Candidatus Epulonipiscium fishelsonii]|uniref:Alcohol dehydrogenase n=1 Tax=Candidatus Epulonipiscium fishelsonii TaxID=77094 RepID=A0ACC8XFH0_9FIRM|nr:alcohol dehydrogenase [Epulopiscium sp. SCG-B11WGA-EpuloA1]ONI43249.1 alcohol dehydrogenase [Epulopiscium sp. SCG-B05WGA-EpuloA1]